MPLLIAALVLPVGARAADAQGPLVSLATADLVLLVLLLLLALVLNAFFLFMQTAVGGLGPVGLESLRQPGYLNERARGILDRIVLLDRYFWCAGLACLCLSMAIAAELGVAFMPVTPAFGALLACSAVLLAHIFLGEMAARSLAFLNPARVIRWLGPLAQALASPIRILVDPALWLARIETSSAEVSREVSDLELRLLPHVAAVSRVMEEEAVEMIDSITSFSHQTAADIMTARTEIEGYPDTISAEELISSLRHSPYSRVVVYHRNLDNIVGILLTKDVLLRQPEDPMSLMRQPLVVPKTMRLMELLQEIRNARTHLAVVTDEYGGTAGIVTLHNLFEQIIGGHIEDDSGDDELWIDRREEGQAWLSGMVEIWEVNEELGLDLDESVARTIGGYLFARLGRTPAIGDTWEEEDGTFTVTGVVDNRVETVSFQRSKPAAGTAAGPGSRADG